MQPRPDGGGDDNTSGLDDALLERRPVYFDETAGFVECPIYRRESLPPASELDGPAILEGMDSTVVINPGWRARIDEYGNCILIGSGSP